MHVLCLDMDETRGNHAKWSQSEIMLSEVNQKERDKYNERSLSYVEL